MRYVVRACGICGPLEIVYLLEPSKSARSKFKKCYDVEIVKSMKDCDIVHCDRTSDCVLIKVRTTAKALYQRQ